jgi:hypothetical protein
VGVETRAQDSSTCERPSRSALFRQLGWFGGGAALAVLAALTRDMHAEPAAVGDTAFWAVDRDAHRLYGLDRDLLIGRAVPVDYPLEVEPVPDGGTWVLRSANGVTSASMRLDRLDPRGVVITELYLESCRDLDTLERDQALVLENVNGSVRLARVREEGSLFPLLSRPDLSCVSGSSNGTVLCGTSGGAVLRVDSQSGAVLAEVQLDGTIRDLAPGPTPGTVWALDTQGTGRLFLLEESLAIRWAAGVGFACAHLGAVPGEERVWVADTASARVRRFGANAVVELDQQGLPGNNFDRAIAWRDGGVLLITPGAIVHVAANGTVAAGQGGFAWLSDGARVR